MGSGLGVWWKGEGRKWRVEGVGYRTRCLSAPLRTRRVSLYEYGFLYYHMASVTPSAAAPQSQGTTSPDTSIMALALSIDNVLPTLALTVGDQSLPTPPPSMSSLALGTGPVSTMQRDGWDAPHSTTPPRLHQQQRSPYRGGGTPQTLTTAP